MTRDAERTNSRRPPFRRPFPRLFAASRRRSRPLTLPQERRQPAPENRPCSRFLTPSDPPNSPALGGSLTTRANPRPPSRGRLPASQDQTLSSRVACVDRSLHPFCQVRKDFRGRRAARMLRQPRRGLAAQRGRRMLRPGPSPGPLGITGTSRLSSPQGGHRGAGQRCAAGHYCGGKRMRADVRRTGCGDDPADRPQIRPARLARPPGRPSCWRERCGP